MSGPFACRWQNGKFVPVQFYVEECKRNFGEGELVRLEEVQPRSQESHGHFFAVINNAFKNLPEKYAGKFSGPGHLRKWALIKAGYRTENVIVCIDGDQATKSAALVKELDEFAVTVINENVVTVYRAVSQSKRDMGAKTFQASKDAVFGVLAELLGVDPTTLQENAEASA